MALNLSPSRGNHTSWQGIKHLPKFQTLVTWRAGYVNKIDKFNSFPVKHSKIWTLWIVTTEDLLFHFWGDESKVNFRCNNTFSYHLITKKCTHNICNVDSIKIWLHIIYSRVGKHFRFKPGEFIPPTQKILGSILPVKLSARHNLKLYDTQIKAMNIFFLHALYDGVRHINWVNHKKRKNIAWCLRRWTLPPPPPPPPGSVPLRMRLYVQILIST